MFENGCFLRRQKRFKLPHKESGSSRRKKDRTVKQERQQNSIVYDNSALIKEEYKSVLNGSSNSPDNAELARLSMSKNDELNGSPNNRIEVSIR